MAMGDEVSRDDVVTTGVEEKVKNEREIVWRGGVRISLKTAISLMAVMKRFSVVVSLGESDSVGRWV